MIYYNENNPKAVKWLKHLASLDIIPNGIVDDRSIAEVHPNDLRGFTACHFFAGIGGWPYAARLAGWPDSRPFWSGSCPCQPFSVAGKGKGVSDARHLWPHFFRLIRARRPSVILGEQVAGKAGRGWLDGVRSDLAAENYASRGVDIPACAVDAPHIRSRLYWVARDMADTRLLDRRSRPGNSKNRQELANLHERDGGNVVHPESVGWREGESQRELRGGRSAPAEPNAPDSNLDDADSDREFQRKGNVSDIRRWALHPDESDSNLGDADSERLALWRSERSDNAEEQSPVKRANGRNGSFYSDAEWIICHDQKARRTKSGLPLLAHGVPGRVALWRGFGNAINPILAAEVIGAYMDEYPL